MLAKVFHKGIIETEKQEKVISDLLGDLNQPVEAIYSDEYKALKYLNSDYKSLLEFKDGIAVAEKGGPVNPLTPAVFALHAYNEGDKEQFEKHVSYLKGKALGDGDESYWYYQEAVKRFGLNAPWVSGISQGIIASVFIRKYKDSQEEEYLQFAKASIAYCLNNKNGLLTEGEKGFWIEEYPAGVGKGVLNGFIFFLIALGELASMGFYKEKFDLGIRTLLHELPSFHKGTFILYGKHIPDLGNELYDRIHFHQLNALYALTSVSGFYSLKDYWRKTSVTELS